ncbi:MAG: Nif3-like dinuclear metal center hexameric protein [Gemella sp.]|nr:Nif3-like dinuclear metal center hexameric protein [Gemella sp.]
MVKVKDIYSFIKDLADENLAESWDNVGLILGDENQKVEKILVCLDVTTDVVKEAKEKSIDLIISHHPLIFKGIRNINFNDFKGKILKELIKNDISVISAHTNLDSAKFGLNDYLSKLLELQETKVLVPNKQVEDTGLGRIGNLSESMSQEEFIEYAKEKLGLKFVKLVKANDINIKSVAILGGSGASFIQTLPEVDIYLTGDIGYHDAVDAIEMNQNLLDIGHFAEKASKALFKSYLEKLPTSNSYEVVIAESERDPFKIY